ncbi:MAG: hypothetical protein V8S14_08480 [Lachnospiraceae bacterium]
MFQMLVNSEGVLTVLVISIPAVKKALAQIKRIATDQKRLTAGKASWSLWRKAKNKLKKKKTTGGQQS